MEYSDEEQNEKIVLHVWPCKRVKKLEDHETVDLKSASIDGNSS
jgi:hypothetical protein